MRHINLSNDCTYSIGPYEKKNLDMELHKKCRHVRTMERNSHISRSMG